MVSFMFLFRPRRLVLIAGSLLLVSVYIVVRLATRSGGDLRRFVESHEGVDRTSTKLNGFYGCKLNCDHLDDSESVLFREKPLVIWSNDYHIGPIQDLKHLLGPLGVTFIDKSLSGNCNETATCAKNLRVIQPESGLELHPNLIPRFHQTYSQDPEMLSVDAFVCFHPSAMCELFMPFNRSILVIATTRYEMGRWSEERWKKWNDNLLAISKTPKNLIASNNAYDANYIEYFTGIRPIILPSFCGYVEAKYNPTELAFLLAPIHKTGFREMFMFLYTEACDRRSMGCPRLTPMRQLYPKYKYSDLASHPGIVYVPYQVSVTSIFEQYRMGIPLFFPSIDLLTEWQYKHQVMRERTWDGVNNKRPSESILPPHQSQIGVPDPNNETDREAIRYWISFADFYNFPHIIIYDSVDDLLDKIIHTNLKAVSQRMLAFSLEHKKYLIQQWKHVIVNIARDSVNQPC